MIVAGLLCHGAPPQAVPQLDGIARLVVAVNARTAIEPTPWRGFGANHNQLMDEHSDAEWYVVLNPDVDVSAEQLATLIEHADAQGYSVAGPLRQEPWGLQGQPSMEFPTPAHFLRATYRTKHLTRIRSPLPRTYDSMYESAWIAGCCMAIRGDLLHELRFDERYFMYFEDADICQRARRLGAHIGVCMAVTVRHTSGWRHDDPLVANRGVEYARSAMLYAEANGHSPRDMRLAAFTWALPRAWVPGRSADERAASRAFAKGLAFPTKPGISELALAHNKLYGFHVRDSAKP